MEQHGVYNIIFSSSSKVYGVPQYLPLDEKHPTGTCTNPYGRTKHMVEHILHDLTVSNSVRYTLLLHSDMIFLQEQRRLTIPSQ